MDLRSLRYFVATVEAGTVSGAALRCHIAQPSISNAILQLEGEFNKIFFVRQAKGVVPTAAGLKFYQQAKALLAHADDMHRSLLQSETRQRITLYIPPTLTSHWLERWCRLLRDHAGEYQWTLVSVPEDADLSLRVVIAPDESRYFFPLQEQFYHLLCHRGHPLCLERHIAMEQLADQPFIERRYCELNPVLQQFRAMGALPVNVVAQADNEDWALALVSAGMGITFAPHDPQHLPESIAAIPLSRIQGAPLLTRMLGLSVPSHHAEAERFVALCNRLADEFSKPNGLAR